MENESPISNVTTPKFWVAIVPIIVLIISLWINVTIYSDNSSFGPNQISLLLCAGVAGVLGVLQGQKWDDLFRNAVGNIATTIPAMIILLLIGALAGTWLISGVIPTMVYYGLQILNPTIFLFAACAVSAIVSLATGSSWSTIATVGVAMLGIGQNLGIESPVIAGAIISGAYFGDKMSPLSDTTNLAPAMAGAELFVHIRYMLWTTIPTMSITLVIFLIWGFTIDNSTSTENIENILLELQNKFSITPWLFLIPGAVIFLIIKKVPAAPALLIGTFLGALEALIFQPKVIQEIGGSDASTFRNGYIAIITAMADSVSLKSDIESVADLLSSKGMVGMLNTVWLIITAMTFGGIMVATGFLSTITKSVLQLVKSTGSLVATTAMTCFGFNLATSDQYLAIVVPGKMFSEEYKKRGLSPELLSRTLEDSGTVTSVLIPWNTCGNAQASVLGVATGEYWMYCFFNILSPLMTIAQAYLGFGIRKK